MISSASDTRSVPKVTAPRWGPGIHLVLNTVYDPDTKPLAVRRDGRPDRSRKLPKQLHSVMPSDLDRSSSHLSSSLSHFSDPVQPDRSTPALRTDNRRRSQATLSQGKRNLDRRGERPGRRFPCHGTSRRWGNHTPELTAS